MPTRWSHSSSRTKAVHLTPPILPSCNYCGNLAHKPSECNIPFEDLFNDYCGKEGHQKAICFAKFLEWMHLWLLGQNLPASSATFNQKPRHFSLPLKFSSLRVILVRMLRRRSIMLTRGRCFKPMSLKFKLCKMNWNHWRWCVPKLLDKLKCESEVKTTDEQGVRAHSLARNTLGIGGHVGAPRWD
jgi:hypothetical protein